MASEVPGGGQLRDVRTGQELRAYARDRLIESRLTPNGISITGLVLNLAAAALGAMVACLAAVTAHQLARLRPDAWSWREGIDEAPA